VNCEQSEIPVGLCLQLRTAVFSPDRAYRYRLKQTWDGTLPHLCFLILNPSIADEVKNDPTVERCERRARATAGCGGLEVINIFAYQTTDPAEMKAQPDPIGPENDRHIIEAASSASMVICAWGNHGDHMDRGRVVIRLLREKGITCGLGRAASPATRYTLATTFNRHFGKRT
jgi:hypothetical protein